MEPIEIHLNRRGINSIEAPREVVATSGVPLTIRLINHENPLHITLASPNSALYTDFYHENLFVEDVLEYRIPIQEIIHEGYFDIDVITGYGTKKVSFRVFVKRPEKKEKEEERVEEHPVIKPRKRPVRFPWLLIIVVLLAGISFAAWIEYGVVLLSYLAFALLLIGVAVAWFSRR